LQIEVATWSWKKEDAERDSELKVDELLFSVIECA
jgi:hypothetical protein